MMRGDASERRARGRGGELAEGGECLTKPSTSSCLTRVRLITVDPTSIGRHAFVGRGGRRGT